MPDFWGLRFQKCFRKVFWHGYSDLDEFDNLGDTIWSHG